MSNERVSIHIVTWNSLQHIPSCLHAVTQQTFASRSVLIVDNASADGTVEWLREHYPSTHLLRNTRNTGFSRAHNQAIRISHSDYILVLNPDVVLTPTWLAHAVEFMDAHPKYGAFGGKTLRYSYSRDELKEVTISGIIDSTALQPFRNRHIVDRGIGEQDTGQYDQAEDVFGISGACVLFRRAAIETVRYTEEYFDEHFFAYKEDVDMAWRLQRAGYAARYDGQTVAYHHREIRGAEGQGNLHIARQHTARDRMIAYFSYRNHWLLLFKHETRSTFMRSFWTITWYEIRKFVYLACTRPSTLRGFFDAVRLRPAMRRKAEMLNQQAARTALEVTSTFT